MTIGDNRFQLATHCVELGCDVPGCGRLLPHPDNESGIDEEHKAYACATRQAEQGICGF
jgi:hypothetical protein